MEGFNDSVDYELLGRYLAGECSPAEADLVKEWLAASPENPEILRALQEIWEKAASDPSEETVNVDAAWKRVQGRMGSKREEINPQLPLEVVQGGDESKPEEINPQVDQTGMGSRPLEIPLRPGRSAGVKWFMRIAAVLFVVVSTGLILLLVQNSKTPQVEMLALESGDGQRTDTLPDGTVVSLNAHSRLEFPAMFADGERLVKLEGEGFFDVAHDAAHPFRIQAGPVDVRVLGTSFNLSTRGDEVHVAVLTGKVKLTEVDDGLKTHNRSMLVTAGNSGRYDVETGAMLAERDVFGEKGEVENYLFWKTGKLVFRDRPLHAVVTELNARLGDSIVIGSDAIRNCALSTTFEKPSIASALNVIAATFNLEVTQHEKFYEISGSGCE